MMLRILMTFLLVLASFSVKVEAGIMDLLHSAFTKQTPPQPQSIRVLLTHDQPGVVLEVKGKYLIFDPRTNQLINSSYGGKRKLVQSTNDGLRWGEEFPGVYQILIVPENKEITTIVDGIEYYGNIYVYDVGGSISVVNQVDVEEYLNSILPQRFKDDLPEELLAALAITTRTNSYYQAQNSKTPYWDVDASQVGYHGYGLTRRSKNIDKAIRDTQYILLHRVGKKDWEVTPFAVDWRPGSGGKIYKETLYSAITLEEAQDLVKRGNNAVQLLEKAFPGTHVQLMQFSQG